MKAADDAHDSTAPRAANPGRASARPAVDLAAAARHAWMSVFFVSALLLVIALSFGTTDELGNPRFGTTLENIRASSSRPTCG